MLSCAGGGNESRILCVLVEFAILRVSLAPTLSLIASPCQRESRVLRPIVRRPHSTRSHPRANAWRDLLELVRREFLEPHRHEVRKKAIWAGGRGRPRANRVQALLCHDEPRGHLGAELRAEPRTARPVHTRCIEWTRKPCSQIVGCPDLIIQKFDRILDLHGGGVCPNPRIDPRIELRCRNVVAVQRRALVGGVVALPGLCQHRGVNVAVLAPECRNVFEKVLRALEAEQQGHRVCGGDGDAT